MADQPSASTWPVARSWIAAGLAAVLALGSVLAFATMHGLSWPSGLLWLILAPAFAIAERTEIHFEFRKQTVSWSLNEIPSVVGLVLFGVEATVLCRAAAVALSLPWSRYSAPKRLFNVSLAAFEVMVAGVLLNAFELTDMSRPVIWLGLVVCLLLAGLLGVACIAGAIRITEGRISSNFWSALAAPPLLISPVTTGMGLIVLLLLEISPWAGLLAVLMLGVFVLLYRRYAAAAQDRRSLAEVYDFAEMVQGCASTDEAMRAVLEVVREKFNATCAGLWIPPHLDRKPRLLSVGTAGTDDYRGPDDADDAIRLEIVAGQRARIVNRGAETTAREQIGLDRRGVDELLGVPLSAETQESGYLEVCDRQGSVLQFSAADVGLMQSLATHIESALRQGQLLARIRYDAAHDQVTDLPNRSWLTATIDAHLAADPGRRRLAVLVADIDGFDQVNETLGHAAGDELLRVIASTLQRHAPTDVQVARLGGSQFAVLLPRASLDRAEVAAQVLHQAVSSRAQVAGLQLAVAVTLGVAVGPLHGDTAELLLQRADLAVLAARTRGRQMATYSPAMDEQSMRRLRLGADLPEAIDGRQISVLFQPIVHTSSGEIAAVELLARWEHPRFGSVAPDEFVPLAERTGLVAPLTRHVLDTAIQRAQVWKDRGLAISVAVNLSSICLAEPGFVSDVELNLAAQGLPAELLTFEITEGSFIGDALARSALDQLHELGIRLSVDDFGTGYSSLSYLRRLPIDEVKIDKSFVLGMSSDASTCTITRSIVDLAHSLGLRVVAEGVEDQRTRDLLTAMGCDYLQGYLLARPLNEEQLDSWLAAHTPSRQSAGQ